jgi:hypothetical protein
VRGALGIGLLLAACNAESTPRSPCGAVTLASSVPADGAVAVSDPSVVSLTLDAPAQGVEVWVDGGGLDGWTPLEGSGPSWSVDLDHALAPGATHTLSLRRCGVVHDQASFSMGDAPVGDTVVGRAFLLDLWAEDLQWSDPPVRPPEALLEAVLDETRGVMIAPMAVDGTALTLGLALAEAGSGRLRQEACVPPVVLDDVDFSVDPHFAVHADAVILDETASGAGLLDVTVSGRFLPGGDGISGVRMQALLDTQTVSVGGLDLCGVADQLLQAACVACPEQGEEDAGGVFGARRVCTAAGRGPRPGLPGGAAAPFGVPMRGWPSQRWLSLCCGLACWALAGWGLAGCVLLTDEDRRAHTDQDGDGVAADSDCDDTDPAVGLATPEVCNAVDDDCDGDIDEGLRPDADLDGYGASTADGPCFVDWVPDSSDCDDAEPTVYPGALERCDGLNNACVDDWTPEAELGVVTWVSADGTAVEDWSDDFGSGRLGSPVSLELPAAGTLAVCRGEDAYAVRLSAIEPAGLSVRGRRISRADDVDEWDSMPVVDGLDSGAEPGPVVVVSGTSAVISMRDLHLRGGQSTALQPGGGVSARGGQHITLRDVMLTANLAAEEAPGGAAMYAQYVTRLDLVDVFVTGNATASGGRGAGLYALNTDVRMNGSVFADNQAFGGGGAIHLETSRLEAWDSSLVQNAGASGGGGLFVSFGSDGYLYDTVFEGNTGDLGGAARVEGNLSCFSVGETTTFVDNLAEHAGGMYAVIGGGRASFDGCSVTDNTVDPGRIEAAVDLPDLVVSADTASTTVAWHYAVTGGVWFCSLATGCVGDVLGE